jgi:NDP-hexose-3-ketoreductase
MKKIGIVGNASIYKNKWEPVLRKSNNFQLAGVAREFAPISTNKEERFGYKSFFKSEVDIVYIPLPNNLHYEISKFYLEKGINVIIEKPTTPSLLETQELVNLANKNSCFILESFQWRYHSRTKYLFEEINNGLTPYLIDVVFTVPHFPENNIRYSKKLNGGAALDLGSYPVSVITTLFPHLEFKLADFSSWNENYNVDVGGSGTFICDNPKIIFKFFYAFGLDYESKLILHTNNGRFEINQPFTISSNQEALVLIDKNLNLIKKTFKDCHFNSMLNFISSDFEYSEVNNQTLKQSKILNKIIERL